MSNATTTNEAKKAIDDLINKARVHFYKPIQIAEILFKHRTEKKINLTDLTTYRIVSKKWRDIICDRFIGRSSTSSAKYQDDIFNETAIPPRILALLGKENIKGRGIVEAYIYKRFAERTQQMNSALSYAITQTNQTFDLREFLDMFWHDAGLKRSLDKVYEIIVYALFDALVEAAEVKINVSFNQEKAYVLQEFKDFADKVLNLSAESPGITIPAKINRVGVTNAADRGLDMFSNFGVVIQIKHLSLTEDKAEAIADSITADRIVIVCKDAEKGLILSLLNQIGWKARIQSIIVESELIDWYKKALKGQYAQLMSEKLLENIRHQLVQEFPSSNNLDFLNFMEDRGYVDLNSRVWSIS